MASRVPRVCGRVLSPHLRRALSTEAWRALHHPDWKPGETLLPHAALGGMTPHIPTTVPHLPTSLDSKAAALTAARGAGLHALPAVPSSALLGGTPAYTLPALCSHTPATFQPPFSLVHPLRHAHTVVESSLKEVKEGVREAGTLAAAHTDVAQAPRGSLSIDESPPAEAEEQVGGRGGQYWRIPRRKLYREDGTEWPWNCFKPGDAYIADTKIELHRHYSPGNWGDTFAKYLVKSLRIPTDLFFQRRYGCRAMMLETVAAVPGMVAGMLLHLKSLRLIEHSGGWIKALLEEAENERMHLMTFMEIAQPRWYERALIFSVQAVFFTCYTAAYVISPRVAHRIVGYLEEEAVHSYTEFLKDIDAGNIENVPAPKIAIDYWRLPKDARLRDVVVVVRADEAHHRDVNHFAADIVQEGKKLKDNPAPVDYH